ncbi:MAG TPA: ABC transporter ATP-binding protein [Candidatus Saccharimonadales bacterium]|nr:ABC transporter ATP-binding protein [Candidatus Saccharimonadales bacterium]
MMPQIYEAIERAIASGTPPQYIAASLQRAGWPETLVNEALNAWLNAHGRLQKKTDFKQWLARYRHKALPAVVAVSAMGVVLSATTLLKPWPTKIMVDSAFGNIKAPGPLAQYTHTPKLILITSLLTILIFILSAVFGLLHDFVVLRLSFWLNRDIKAESFRHILHLPLHHQERLAKGDYIYRQNILTNSLGGLVLDTTSSIIQSIVMILGIIAIMMTFNFGLTIISVIVIPFLFLLIRVFGPPLGRLAQQISQVNTKTSASITESVDNAETVQSFNLEEKQMEKVNQLWWKSYWLTRKGMVLSHFYQSTNSLLIILGTSAVMYLGGSAALNAEMTLGQLLIFMTYMGYLLGPVETLATEIAARNQKLVDVSRVYEVLSDHEGVEELRGENHLPITSGRIEFQNVSYSYGDTMVLSNVNLVIEPGQKAAIIGPSGAGKSTILELLPLFIEPTAGRVLIDNVDVQSVSLKELRQNIAWISQTPQLFSGTVLDNLLDGDVYRQITMPEIESVIAVANVKEFTDRLPLGLQTGVGEGGSALSGGQRQRIAIARGLIKNSKIICMDEPTAALDSKSENFIRDSIGQLIAGKTVLMVTHRKALLSLMDVIYVLDGGHLIDVNSLGGIDAYLATINSGEDAALNSAKKQAQQAEEELLARQKQRLAQLETENARLEQSLKSSKPAEDGTVYINH